MTNYSRGRGFEYEAKHELEKRGFVVVRAAGSHSAFDLVAFNCDLNRVLCIQCKRVAARRSWPKKAIIELERIAVPTGVEKQLWVRRRGSREVEVIPIN